MAFKIALYPAWGCQQRKAYRMSLPTHPEKTALLRSISRGEPSVTQAFQQFDVIASCAFQRGLIAASRMLQEAGYMDKAVAVMELPDPYSRRPNDFDERR